MISMSYLQMVASTRRPPPPSVNLGCNFICTPIHTSFIYWEYFCLPKQTESFSNKYNLGKIHAHMTRLLIRFNWRECCFLRLQSWSCPVTGHTAYSTYTTYSKLFQPLQFFFSCFILLCLVVSFYFLLIHVPNVLLPSCVPPKPGFPWYLSHISLISTALFLVSLNLQLTPSLVGMRCSFLTRFCVRTTRSRP